MEGSCSYKDNDSSDETKTVIMIKIILVSSVNDNTSKIKVIEEIMNNNSSSTNNSDRTVNNNDNDNNITYCNITIIILQLSET